MLVPEIQYVTSMGIGEPWNTSLIVDLDTFGHGHGIGVWMRNFSHGGEAGSRCVREDANVSASEGGDHFLCRSNEPCSGRAPVGCGAQENVEDTERVMTSTG